MKFEISLLVGLIFDIKVIISNTRRFTPLEIVQSS